MKNFKKLLCVLLAVCLLIPFASCKKEEAKTDDTTAAPTTEPTTVAQPEPANINPLTGIADLDEAVIGKRPLAIMVENHPDARPQWGLNTPDIVVEGLVEGGITRMMWIYSDVSKVEKIGPCRSSRINYIEVAEAFDAIYAHFGGSPTAYSMMNGDSSIDHIDFNFSDGKFERDQSRNVAIEHRATTKGEWINDAIAKKGFRTDIDEEYAKPFVFSKTKLELPGGKCEEVKAVFSTGYAHTFKYNADDGLYYNYMNSNPMKDGVTDEQMSVSNVLILSCNVTTFDYKYAQWNLTSGTGYYISNGTYQEINWKKGDGKVHDRFEFTDADGNELKFNTGKFWIGFVPNGNTTVS